MSLRTLVVLGFLLPMLRTVAGLNVNAFENPGFEDRSKFHEETNGVQVAGGLGYSTSGGLRLYPARDKAGKLQHAFGTSFRPKAGTRYRFGFSYKPHGRLFAHCYWESYRGGRYVDGNWNVSEEPLADGWRRKWVTFVPKTDEADRHVFATIALSADANSQVCTNMDEYVEYDDVFLEENRPEWHLTNVWPTHNCVYSDNPRVRFYSGYSGAFIPQGGRAAFRVELLDATRRRIAEATAADERGSFTVDFGKPLACRGAGTLRVTVTDAVSGRTCGTNEIAVTVGPTARPGPGGTFVTEDGLALLDGKPFMPLGFFASFGYTRDLEKFRTTMPAWKEAGANLLLEYWFDAWREKTPEVLRILEANGIRLMLNVSAWHHRKDLLMTEHRTVIERYRAEPTLFGYYLTDEAPMTLIPYVEALRRMVNAVDPDHPTWECNLFDPPAYLKISDCYGADFYPIDLGSKGLAGMNADMEKWAVCRPSVAWLCPQVFNKANYRPHAMDTREAYEKSGREPTEEAMLAVALLQASWGAKGFIFYQWDDLFRGPVPERYEPRRRAALNVIRTLKGLEPFVLSRRPPTEVAQRDERGHTRVVRMEADDGRAVILAIGLDLDNACSFAGLDGAATTFQGGEFSCRIYR